MNPVLVLTNLPNPDSARQIASLLVDSGLAACVNVLAPCTSIYHWQGRSESAEEIPMLIKTTEDRYMEVEAVICKHHPYELPEIVCVPLTAGLPAYLDWIQTETHRLPCANS